MTRAILARAHLQPLRFTVIPCESNGASSFLDREPAGLASYDRIIGTFCRNRPGRFVRMVTL